MNTAGVVAGERAYVLAYRMSVSYQGWTGTHVGVGVYVREHVGVPAWGLASWCYV